MEKIAKKQEGELKRGTGLCNKYRDKYKKCRCSILVLAIGILLLYPIILSLSGFVKTEPISISDLINNLCAAGVLFVIIVASKQYSESKMANKITITHKCMDDYRRVCRKIQRENYKCKSKTATKQDIEAELDILKLDLIHMLEEQCQYCKGGYILDEMKVFLSQNIENHLNNKDETSCGLNIRKYVIEHEDNYPCLYDLILKSKKSL